MLARAEVNGHRKLMEAVDVQSVSANEVIVLVLSDAKNGGTTAEKQLIGILVLVE